jgi:CDGSH-type Zn-finger protein
MPKIKATKDGPYLVDSGIEVEDAQGNVTTCEKPCALCRCGQSKNKPFCDGAHKTIGFRSEK